MLERNLGVRLFQRSTRKLTLTDAGERFLLAVKDNLEGVQQAISDVAADRCEPTGVLKVSMGLNLGPTISSRSSRRFWRAIRTFVRTGNSRRGRSI
jgi:DNA-binding transcriptional LysR family regulator